MRRGTRTYAHSSIAVAKSQVEWLDRDKRVCDECKDRYTPAADDPPGLNLCRLHRPRRTSEPQRRSTELAHSASGLYEVTCADCNVWQYASGLPTPCHVCGKPLC